MDTATPGYSTTGVEICFYSCKDQWFLSRETHPTREDGGSLPKGLRDPIRTDFLVTRIGPILQHLHRFVHIGYPYLTGAFGPAKVDQN